MNNQEEVIISNGKIEKTFIVSAEVDVRYSADEKENIEDELNAKQQLKQGEI